MSFSVLNQIGEWNPQLFRELKGRIKVRNLVVTSIMSLSGQILLMLYFLSKLSMSGDPKSMWSRYCTGSNWSAYSGASCFILQGKPVFNWQLWALDLFMCLSLISIFIVLVAGTFMLINDVVREEQRGTLNFIRLCPQSVQTLLIGKLLGTPTLLYFAFILALPLHFWSGLTAGIPLSLILIFDAVLIGSMMVCYSAALLFGLVSSWIGGFSPWLGSGTILLFSLLASAKPVTHDSLDIVKVFSPATVLPYLVPQAYLEATQIFSERANYLSSKLQELQWFYQPVGTNIFTATAFILLSYGLLIALIWHSLQRCFWSSNTTVLSKRQSYWLTIFYAVLSLGFALQKDAIYSYQISMLWFFNVVYFACLIATLCPHRQTLQDWARYQQERFKTGKKYSLVRDLIQGEKSPATAAIAVNLCLVFVIWAPILLFRADDKATRYAFSGLLLTASFILMCAALAQLILLMKSPKRVLWATLSVVTGIALPPMILSIFSIYAGRKWGGLWLLTGFPTDAVNYASVMAISQALLIHLACFSTLTWQLTRQLRKAGESQLKELMAKRRALPASH